MDRMKKILCAQHHHAYHCCTHLKHIFAIFIVILVLISSKSFIIAQNPNNRNTALNGLFSRELQNGLIPQWSLQEVLPQNYNNQQPPNINGAPVDVEISLSILSFQRINENEQSFVADVFLHKKWTDRRLTLPRGYNPKKKLVLSSHWLPRIWSPSLNFRNARSSSISTAINPTIYVTLSNNSEVFVAVKMSLDLKCKMEFSKYPFDSHMCHIEITSLAHQVDVLNLKWGKFEITKNLFLPQFQVEATSQENCLNSYPIGTFSCLKAKFRMVRNIGNFLISRYIPSFLIVCLSFTGFWIPTSAYPARVGLCITSLLALITQQYQNTLNVSYIYALNVWMMMCIFFVFACLIQYSFAISDWSELPFHYKKGKYNLNSGQITEMSVVIGNGRIASPTQPQNNHRNNKTSPHDVDNSQEKKNKKWTNRIISWNLLKPNSRNNRVDMISRLVFPSLYILGTFIYFVVYLI